MPGQFQYQTVPSPQPPQKRTIFRWYKRQKKGAKIGIGCGTLFLVFLLCGTMSGIVANATGANNVAQVPTVTPIHVASIATSQPTHQTVKTTAIVKPTNTPIPTTVPTQVPTAIPTAVPTQAPVATTAPTQPPAQTGVNGNPWGYNFVPGNSIYAPASAFCSYFTCVSTFWKDTNGYVVECVNGRYSHSGGVSGACSRDGGEAQTLYSH